MGLVVVVVPPPGENLPTTIVTVVPWLAGVPPAGLWFSTIPFWVGSDTGWDWADTPYPAEVSIERAGCCGWPTRLGPWAWRGGRPLAPTGLTGRPGLSLPPGEARA